MHIWEQAAMGVKIKVGAKYQVVIPKAIREKVPILPGQRVFVEERNGVIFILPQGKSVQESIFDSPQIPPQKSPVGKKREIAEAVDRLLSLPPTPVPESWEKFEEDLARLHKSCK
jgi:AbrB family looped-hinge helix DNA binding protein